jgi:hypothetical protein
VPEGAAITTTDNQHAVRVRMCEERDVDQRLMVGELFVDAGLQRPAEDQRFAWAFEVQHLERLPRRVLRIQPLAYPIALLAAAVGRFSKPLVHAEWAPLRGVRGCAAAAWTRPSALRLRFDAIFVGQVELAAIDLHNADALGFEVVAQDRNRGLRIARRAAREHVYGGVAIFGPRVNHQMTLRDDRHTGDADRTERIDLQVEQVHVECLDHVAQSAFGHIR